MNHYGITRVLEPQNVLPTSAWRIDNSRKLYPNEIRIGIKKIHVENTSFKQICMESGNDDDRIRQKIIDIVIKRGKLHNPVTDTGGLLCGVVEEIGSEYDNPKGLKVGDEVLCNSSLTTIPVYIDKIGEIDKVYAQFDAQGYAIAYDQIPVVRKPKGAPDRLVLFIFNESGTLYKLANCVQDKKDFLVVGNNILMNIIYGFTIRSKAGKDARIVCLLDRKSSMNIKGEKVENLLNEVFDEIHYANILKPVECLERLDVNSPFDLSVNCADVPGAETINILATKSGGTVIFANLINNYNIALYVTEAISRELDIRCADGYLEKYDAFDISIAREIAPYLEDSVVSDFNYGYGKEDYVEKEKRLFNASAETKALIEDFVCESRPMIAVLDEMISVSKYDCNVLITGDTGVGKEKAANIIQKNSNRNVQPFVKINCASISPNLIESEFFGYEKGAFTGANPLGKKGYFEIADHGVIFLDEVGELPLDMQAKLLRVIQDGEFFKVGGATPIKTDVRIISATNRNLEEYVQKGLFRRDLYYRLNVFPIRIPSLRERPEDIPALIWHFIKEYGKKLVRKEVLTRMRLNA